MTRLRGLDGQKGFFNTSLKKRGRETEEDIPREHHEGP